MVTQILPIEDEQVEAAIDPTQIVPLPNGAPQLQKVPKNKKASIWGFFAAGKANQSINIPLNETQGTSLLPSFSLPGVEYTGEFSIDRETGLVRFSKQFFYYTRSTDPAGNKVLWKWPCIVALRVACCVRDTGNRQPQHYTKLMPLINNNSGVRVVKDHGAQASYWGELSPGDNALKKVHDNITETIFPNQPPLQEEATYYLQAAAKEFQTPSPQEGTYVGIVPINPDGAIQSVSWMVNEKGATTKASYNCELHLVTIPFAERRMCEQLWGARQEFQKAMTEAQRVDGQVNPKLQQLG